MMTVINISDEEKSTDQPPNETGSGRKDRNNQQEPDGSNEKELERCRERMQPWALETGMSNRSSSQSRSSKARNPSNPWTKLFCTYLMKSSRDNP